MRNQGAAARGHQPVGHQLPITETAGTSVMRRKAAGHLRAVSENQGHKIGCRSAVGRVGQQSTQWRQMNWRTARHKAVIQIPIELRRAGNHLSVEPGMVARGTTAPKGAVRRLPVAKTNGGAFVGAQFSVLS